ncbi:MAG TPA: precorrin-8X methylmutase [Bacillota bacterium]|nr:precorrin-8X methylmutase [Bacillota bacterium]
MGYLTNPREIELRSMSIIEELLPEILDRPPGEREIIKRVVHTTGDTAVAGLVLFHDGAVESGLKAIREGKPIATDINMLKAGINQRRLDYFSIRAFCYMRDPGIVALAERDGITRAMAAMRKAAVEADGGIIAVGNAPTALFALCELIQDGRVSPSLVVGTPVGFVGARESKEMLMDSGVPYITVKGTRGGSAIAAAVINALLYLSR